MTPSQLFADIETGCLVDVPQAATSYYNSVRGLTVRQQFFIYPDNFVVCLNSSDGGYEVLELSGDDDATFKHLHKQYFRA